jgi:hypothetical protein
MSTELNDKRVNIKLLLGYLLLYPFYYVIAMFVAILLLAWMFGWSFQFAEKMFYIFAGIMWFVSYVAHIDILMYVLKGNRNKS